MGDVKRPVAIGKKGELWSNLDEEFSLIFDLYRWHESNLTNIDYSSLPYRIQLGIRKIKELKRSEQLRAI